MNRLQPLLAVLLRAWRVVAPHAVAAVAFVLISLSAWLLDMRLGLVISAVCLLVLERKVELGRR